VRTYLFSPEARDDLQDIWIYIAGENPAAADRLEADIYKACDLSFSGRCAGSIWSFTSARPPMQIRLRSCEFFTALAKHRPNSDVDGCRFFHADPESY